MELSRDTIIEAIMALEFNKQNYEKKISELEKWHAQAPTMGHDSTITFWKERLEAAEVALNQLRKF
jgi:hypothetical protein